MKAIQTEYVHRFLVNAIGIAFAKDDLQHFNVQQIFDELSRAEEVTQKGRDQWGNFDWQLSEKRWGSDYLFPYLDKHISEAQRVLQAKYPQPATQRWPGNHKFALCITHDIDLVSKYGTLAQVMRRINRLRQSKPSKKDLLLETIAAASTFRLTHNSDPLWRYHEWMEMEAQHGFKSTFYIFPETLAKPHQWDCSYMYDDRIRFKNREMLVADMLKEINKDGWETGLHGSYFSATDDGILKNEKQHLEEVTGTEIISTRQHYLHYDIYKTTGIHSKAGFKTDSTLGYNRSAGFRCGTGLPFYNWDNMTQQPTTVLEIPQVIMDGGLFRNNSLEYNREMAIEHCLKVIDEVEKTGSCLTINWHPNYIILPDWVEVFKTILQEAKHRNAWGTSAGEIYKWWNKREELLTGKGGQQ